MPHATTARILFIDAYDSFTNNIIALLETVLCVEVHTIKIDEPVSNFADFLKSFSAVVAGPGPGDPRNPKDVGWIRKLWKLDERDRLPVLGICLGFQSLVLAFGGTIHRLEEPRHGVVRKVRGSGEGIFKGVAEVRTVQYHSLYASIGLAGEHKGTGNCDIRTAALKRLDLRPLAWDYEMDNAGYGAEEVTSSNPRRVLMAVEHKSKPFFGIQFHAESICSDDNARKLIEAWWDIAKKWRRPRRDVELFLTLPRSFSLDAGAVQTGSLVEKPILNYRGAIDSLTPSIAMRHFRNMSKQNQILDDDDDDDDIKACNLQNYGETCEVRVETQVINLEEATVPSICETLGLTDGEVVILESELHQRHDVGEYSIIGIISVDSVRLEYEVGTNEVHRILNGQSEAISLLPFGGSIFLYLKSFMNQYNVEGSSQSIPFWGGLMGFISYEACLETIGVTDSPGCTSQRPDLSFIFVERSIVIDHFHQKIHIQTIKPDDRVWVHETTLQLSCIRPSNATSNKSGYFPSKAQMSIPEPSSYKSKIRGCQSSIRAGDSYELCLTTQATIQNQNRLAPWPLYTRLRDLNPAPFSAYVRLGKLTLLSSSPERFLQWSRPSKPPGLSTIEAMDSEEKTIRCQFRPIKGTVKRQPDPNLPPLTLAEATALLATPKERAENLMIVDLIRHDLHGVVGSGRVRVPKLMVVEEYATLFQLVSVIEGTLPIKDYNAPTGIDILAASLPPGSMTGAPKLRSCQILQSLEHHPRGIYSGVLGYIDVGGGGDFSVVIRSAVRWDTDARPPPTSNNDDVIGDDTPMNGNGHAKENTDPPAHPSPSPSPSGNNWTIGAGGAVTSLSTEEGEWEEMIAKLKSTMRLFEL
ncbi:ADC synthase [Usnea florida]